MIINDGIDRNVIQDKDACWEVLCGIMKDTSLYHQYPVDENDFVDNFHKILWSGTLGLIESGVQKINTLEIMNFLKNNRPVDYKTLQKFPTLEKTIDEYINNIFIKENFESKYTFVKKYSLLRELYDKKIDITHYYVESIDPDECLIARRNLEKDTIEQIVSYYQLLLADLKTTTTSLFNPFVGYDVRTLPGANEKLSPLVDDMFYKGTFCGFIGPAKIGKTMAVYQLAQAIESGGEYLGHKCHKAHCLYLDWEMSIAEINQRMKSIDKFNGKEGEWPEFCPLYRTAYTFDEIVNNLDNTLKRKPEIEVVFLDNFYSFYDGNPNDSIEVKKALNRLANVCDNKTVFMVCHTNKAVGIAGGSTDPVYAAAGSSAISGYLADFISITDVDPDTRIKMVDGRYLYHAGRHFANSGRIACKYDSSTYYCYQYIEDASEIQAMARNKKTKESLLEEYPELCKFLGEDGKTLSQIQKEFDNTLTKEKLDKMGFWFSGQNKDRLREGIKTRRFYVECPKE